MGLNSIHTWVDDEVITHQDLNSIKDGVDQELGGGSGTITPSMMTWPLVAQGDIDLNGNDIFNFGSFLGVVHANDETPLSGLFASIADGTVIVLDPGVSNAHSVSDISLVNKHNITIIGFGDSTPVAVGTSCSVAGLSIDSACTGIHISNMRFTGGTSGKPAVLLNGSDNAEINECSFYTDIGVQVGTSGSAAYDCMVSRCKFDGCTTGIDIRSSRDSSLDHNVFDGCTAGISLATSGVAMNFNNFEANLFDNCVQAIVGNYASAASANWGYNSYENNKVYNCSSNALNITGYYRDTVTTNTTEDPVNIGGTECTFSNNIFGSTMNLTATDCIFDNNRVCGAAALAVSSCSLNTNKFLVSTIFGTGSLNDLFGNLVTNPGAFDLGNKFHNAIGNRFTSGISYPSYPTGQFGLNGVS